MDRAEEESEKCFALNAYAPKYLSEICKEKNIVFVTYSTDFDLMDKKKYHIQKKIFLILYQYIQRQN